MATERTRLLVDAGLSKREILRRLKAIEERLDRLDAILVTHEHTDHIAGLVTLAAELGKEKPLPIFLTPLTRRAIPFDPEQKLNLEYFAAGYRFRIGDLEIEPFTIPHDAVDPVGFCFESQGIRLAVCTDLGYMPDSVKHHLYGCQGLVLESNHDLDMLKVGPYPWFVKQRVMSRTGHLSNHAVAEYLEQDFDAHVRVLVLAHLSENNNHPEIARLSAAQALEARSASTRLVISLQTRPTEVFRL